MFSVGKIHLRLFWVNKVLQSSEISKQNSRKPCWGEDLVKMGAEGRDRRPEQLLQDQLVPSGLSALPSQWTHRGTCRQSSLSEFLEVDPASPVCHLAIPTQEHGCVKEKSALNAVKSSKDGFDQGCCDGRDWELNSEQRGGWGRVATGQGELPGRARSGTAGSGRRHPNTAGVPRRSGLLASGKGREAFSDPPLTA